VIVKLAMLAEPSNLLSTGTPCILRNQDLASSIILALAEFALAIFVLGIRVARPLMSG
jgi:hypothetical protein